MTLPVSVLFVWPVDPKFQPTPEQEKAAKAVIQQAVGEDGDVDCDDHPEVRLQPDGTDPYAGRFVIRTCKVDKELRADVLKAVGEQLGCECKQGIVGGDPLVGKDGEEVEDATQGT